MERDTSSSPPGPAGGDGGGQTGGRGNGGRGSGMLLEREQQPDRKFGTHHNINGHDISECRHRFKH